MKEKNKESKNNKFKKGFTLIEMLVVVLIIGILAAIALPQYKIAVTKSKVAAILPMMHHIKDSLMEWKLTHGSYCKDEGCNEGAATISDLGIDCPDGWTCSEYGEMINDYWYCFPNEEEDGAVYCETNIYHIHMYAYDDDNGMWCWSGNKQGRKICKALGGKAIDENSYKLN